MNDDFEKVHEFKFHWLNQNGQPTSMFRKKGNIEGETITLEKSEIPIAAIFQTLIRDKSMVITIATVDPANPYSSLLLQLPSVKAANELKTSIDIIRSAIWAKQHREDLQKKGMGHTFRAGQCPHCDAVLILSDMPETPQLYCHFCDSLSTVDPTLEPIRQEKDLRICEECGMYSKPQKFTIFYFYFLLVVYGFWQKSTWRCPPCMRGEAWKMVFGNLLFVLGFPWAVYQLFRSYGGASVGGVYRGLDTGNLRARKGNLTGALENYREILSKVPVSAGVKYNLGIALLGQNNPRQAAESFELALADCSNYAPAYGQLTALYDQLGETEKRKALQAMWESEEVENTPEAEAVSSGIVENIE